MPSRHLCIIAPLVIVADKLVITNMLLQVGTRQADHCHIARHIAILLGVCRTVHCRDFDRAAKFPACGMEDVSVLCFDPIGRVCDGAQAVWAFSGKQPCWTTLGTNTSSCLIC